MKLDALDELKAVLEAIETVEKKLYESNECSAGLYNEVSDYILIAKDIIIRFYSNIQ